MERVTEVPLLTAEAAGHGDQAAVDAGDTWAGLMERAAGHLARGVVQAAGHGYGLRVAVLAGKGNNGGDGWAAARRLKALGATSWVVAVPGLDVDLSDEATENRRRWIDSGGRTSDGLAHVEDALDWCDVAIDALLGTGVSGSPRGDIGDAAEALLRAYDAGTTVVACDVPSGVSVDDGSVPEGSVRADLTVTFGGHKRGLLLHPARAHAGRVVLGDLGDRYAPPRVDWRALTAAGARPEEFGPGTDKTDRGRVLVVAGAAGKAGAAALCGLGALRAGAGLVTIATPAPARAEVAMQDPSLMTEAMPATDDGAIATDAIDALPDLDGFDAVVAGPGLGYHDGAEEVVAHLRTSAPRLVLDADGLNVHRPDPDALADHTGELVLTPHRRELARIGGGEDGDDAWAHRVDRVPALADKYGATIVAKGPGTIVAAPDGRVWVTPVGGPALGSGGTGDVLAGMIAAAVARAADDVPLAVARAVWWHGFCGDLLGRRTSGFLTSSDLADILPDGLAELKTVADVMPSFPLDT